MSNSYQNYKKEEEYKPFSLIKKRPFLFSHIIMKNLVSSRAVIVIEDCLLQ